MKEEALIDCHDIWILIAISCSAQAASFKNSYFSVSNFEGIRYNRHEATIGRYISISMIRLH
jgi:hypothetical protein